MADVHINQLTADPRELFAKPHLQRLQRDRSGAADRSACRRPPTARTARRPSAAISKRCRAARGSLSDQHAAVADSTWPVTIDEPVTRLMMAAATSAGSQTFSSGHICSTVRLTPS